jgi:4-amino-4-deoxy-L-arabinose transferase-like glycosyltransferase
MNWLIAGSISAFGAFNEWTSRFPSVMASFLAAVAVYSLAGKWFSREGRLFAALGTLTMSSLMQKGTSAEIDSLLILVTALSSLLWINGYLRQWRPVYIWSASLFVLVLAFLVKGPQSPAYFYTAVFAYLLMKKRLSFFFSRAHLIGIVIFLLVLGIYLGFVLQEISFQEYVKMWEEQIKSRGDMTKHSFLKHFAAYPFQVLLSFMPWTLFAFPALFVKDLRNKAREIFKNEVILFSVVLILVNLPVYWLLPNARARYFLPAGPFFAIILAGLFELYIEGAKERRETDVLLRKSLKILSWIALIAALCVPPAIIVMKLSPSPTLLVLDVLIICIAAAGILRGGSFKLESVPVYIALVAGFSFMIYLNLDAQKDSRKDNYQKKIVKEINLLLPDDATVYEMGYRRFLELTCYLNQDVIQVDKFSQLKPLAESKGTVYFVFDTPLLESSSDDEKKAFQQLKWVKMYSKYYRRNRGEIVVGRLK